MTLRRSTVALACLAVACCSPPAPEPTPAPPAARPAATAVPASTPLAPSPADWIDAAQTPGDWSYRPVSGGSLAQFGMRGKPVLGLGCMATSRRVALIRYDTQSARDVPMIVRTETADRTLTAKPSQDGNDVSTALQARDPLLDAMALSKGRFAVEVSGAQALYVPSWPEVTRVIEDCRG